MPIENRNLEPGTKLIATYKKETFRAEVISGDAGKALYTLIPSDGKEYKSPSSLGTAVTKKACNGWTFWSLDTGGTTEPETTLEQPREEPEEPTYIPVEEEDLAEPAATASFRRVPNQKGVDQGQVRLFCDSCQSSFIVPQDKNPKTCPMGHQPS